MFDDKSMHKGFTFEGIIWSMKEQAEENGYHLIRVMDAVRDRQEYSCMITDGLILDLVF